MGIFDGCLLASDVDETLISEGKIAAINIEKIDWFIQEGGLFALSSGRSLEALRQVLSYIDKSKIGPSATFNGGLIYDFSKDEVLYEENISDREKEFVKFVIDNMPEIGIEVHTMDVCYVPNRTEDTDIHEKYENIDACFEDFESIRDKKWIKVLFTPQTAEKRLMLRRAAESFSDGSSVFYDSSATLYGNWCPYLEQLSKEVSKGAALRRLRTLLNLRSNGLFAIGDYYNDVAMLEEADITAVTAGAPDDLKQNADYISCSCADGAVADFIDYLVK